jgi:hypothetical protein
LGSTNFGGTAGEEMSPELLSVLAGGVYLAPPRTPDASLPGRSIFGAG